MVETALGLTVVITVLLFGVHFSEVLWVAIKAQEAAAAAKWDATSLLVHRLPGDYTPAATVPDKAAVMTQERYKDFDGRKSVKKNPSLQLATTATGGLDVECELATDVRFPRGPLPARLSGVYQDVGGIRCQAHADAWLTRIPHAFNEGASGLFGARHVAGAERYRACGFGKPFGATCSSGPTVMLGDWGLAGFEEGQECLLSQAGHCANKAYYGSALAAYDVGGKGKGAAAMTFARSIVGTSPIDANQFWFSFRGEESGFTECVPPTAGEGPNQWVTTPGLDSPVPEYHESYLKRGNCALGWPQNPTTGQCPTTGW